MLDVGAAFMTATGTLDLQITGDGEAATISAQNGDIVITDSNQNVVEIKDEFGQATTVGISDVRSLGVQGDVATDQSVKLNVALAPSNGVTIDGAIENAEMNAALTRVVGGGVTLNAERTLLAADIEATRTSIQFGGEVVLQDDITLTATEVIFSSTIDDDGDALTGSSLTVNANGLTRFGGQVGGVAAVDRLMTDAAGRSEINADMSASGGTLIFNDPVVLTSDVALTDTGSTGIKFNSTVDSVTDAQHTLTLTATAGRVTFSGDIGSGQAGDQRLGALTINEAAEGVVFGDKQAIARVQTTGMVNLGSSAGGIGGVGVVFNGNGGPVSLSPLLTFEIASGDFRLNTEGVLQSNLLVELGDGDFVATADAPIDSGANVTRTLTIDAGAGAVFVNEDIGRRTPLGGLTIVAAAGGVVFGQADVETPGTGGMGPVGRIDTTGPIDLGVGANVLGAITFNAGDGNTLLLRTTGDAVRINGAVQLDSHLEVNTGPNGGDIRLTVDSPVNSQLNEANDLILNAGSGGVFVNADLGGTESVGQVQVVRADAGITFGESDTQTGDGGQGPVNLIRASGPIDLGVNATEITGAGITFNGGAGTLAVETSGSDVRINGNLTLASHVSINTGPNSGDVVFTNDAGIDSAADEFNDLQIDAGLGTVRFNEDIGATSMLGALTVTRADGGVLFGESVSEVPGSGGQGPVDRIRVQGPIDIGTGANVIQGGILFAGGAINGLHVSTLGADMRFNGPVTLGNSVRLETGTDGGNIKFTHDAPIDSAVGRISDLVLNAGTGQVSLNQNIGATTPLGSLVIERADGGAQFGGASTGSLGAGGMGPLEVVHALRGVDVGVGANVIGGDGIDVNGGAATISFMTDNQTIRFNGALDLQSSTHFDTGAGIGDVIFTSGTTINSSDGPEANTTLERNSLTIDAGAGQLVFNADLGGTQRLDQLTVERAAGGVRFGGADNATLGGPGPVRTISTDGAIDIGAGSGLENVIGGGITFNGGAAPLVVTTSGDLVRLNGPTTVASALTVNTSGGELLLTAVATLNSQANESNDLAFDLGTGSATFTADIGDANPLGELQIVNAQDVAFEQTVSVARLLQSAGGGTTTFDGAINTTAAGNAGVELTGTNFTFNAPLTAVGDGRVLITQTGLLDINVGANLRIDGAFVQTGGTVETAANIVTSGDAISIGGPVVLTDGPSANVLLDTTADGSLAGGAITIANTLDGAADSAEIIRINAGTAGDVLIEGRVGSLVRVQTVAVLQARNVTFGDAVVVGNLRQEAGQATTLFAGTIDANSSLERAVDVSTINVSFTEMITTQGDGRVEISNTGVLDIGSRANLLLSGEFLQVGSGDARISADIVTSNDRVQFTGAVVLREDVSIDTGTGEGDILFWSTLDGLVECAQHPTFTSGSGTMRFVGPVGAMTALGDILIVSANDVVFEASLRANSFAQQGSSGETRFAGAVEIKGAAGLDITAGSVRFDGNLDTSLDNGPIRVFAAENIVVNASLGSGSAPVTLTADNQVTFGALGSIVTSDGVVVVTADADGTGGGDIDMADGATIRTGSAAIHLLASGDVRLGSLFTTDLVTVTSFSGGIIDSGDIDRFDINADRTALRARHGIGADNPIDMRVNAIAAENLFEGGIRFDNRINGLLTIGTVDGLTGIMAGPGTPADLGGDIEISNVGTIDVNASIQNNAGGHTIVRAEIPGNLNVNQPIQNRGGDGWIFLFAGEDLIINNSLPEFIGGDPTQPFPEAEISVQNEGAIRGQARGEVIVDNSASDYVIVRTHAERFPDAANLPTLPAKFMDPADFPDPEEDPAFFAELDAALAAQREAVSAQITNVAPIFDIESVDQGGSNLDERARGILKITVGDGLHLERNFHVTVDWGDGNIENYTIPGNPLASDGFILSDGVRNNLSPDATITASFDGGELLPDGTRMPGVYFIHHTYVEPPNPADPSAPIPVKAEIRYDARAEGDTTLDIIQPADGSEIFNGIRFFENLTQEIISVDFDVMTNPGEGAFTFIKVVESEIVPVEFRKISTAVVGANKLTVTSAFGERVEFVTARFEAQTFGDWRLFFRVVDDISGAEFGEFNLPNERIANPITVFTRDYHFPNGHYRVYLEDLRTKRARMILEVHIYEGRVVPGDFRQGATERQPGSDAVETDGPMEQPLLEDGTGLHQPNAEVETGMVNPRNVAEELSSATADHGAGQMAPASATVGGVVAWMAIRPRLRRRLKRKTSNTRRLDKAARITRRLRDHYTS